MTINNGLLNNNTGVRIFRTILIFSCIINILMVNNKYHVSDMGRRT